MPSAKQESIQRAADDFVARLRKTSPIAAEYFREAKMDDDELRSRVALFLHEQSETVEVTVAVPAVVIGTPKQRVVEALQAFPKEWHGATEREQLAEKFLAGLRVSAKAASESLNAGRMTDDEIQSRLTIYFSKSNETAGVSAAQDEETGLVGEYLNANYGAVSQRASSVALKGSVESGAGNRDFVIFRKRPAKLRMHIVKDELVSGIVAYDGTVVWRQETGRPPRILSGEEAAPVIRISRFDDLLVDYAERGATLQVDAKKADDKVFFRMIERDGGETVLEVEAKTQRLLVQKTREPGRDWVEQRFSDYKKVGALVYAAKQEEWIGGKLSSTTHIGDVVTDPGMIDRFFSPPASRVLGYMEYMTGMEQVKEQQRRSLPAQKEAVQ